MSNVVVGPGYTGRRIVDQLSDCISLSRRELDLDDDDASLPDLPGHFTLIYTVPPHKDFEDDRRLQKFLELVGNRALRFVYLSTTGVYGNTNGAAVDEASPLNPQTARARRRVNAESQLLSWRDLTGNALVIFRVPAIYGPGRLGLERIKAGEPVLTEADAGPGNRIHVDDLARICGQALNSSSSGIYNLGDGDHRSGSWFANTVARHCRLPAPPEITLAEAAQSLSPGRLSFLRESRRVRTDKIRSEFDFAPRYADAEEGIRASLDEVGV